MKRIVEEIESEMEKVSYVPNEADALLLIAFYTKKIATALEGKREF